MKKYHIADLLTVNEIILAAFITRATFSKVSADIVIWLFVAAELCDAFDGPCARRWPYPNDNKPRWWRKPSFVQGLEHGSDIFLLSSLAFFLLAQGNIIISRITVIGGVIIASFSIGIEVALRLLGTYAPEEKRRRVIIVRRVIYLCGIVIGIAELLFLTTWASWLKIALCVVGIGIGIALAIYKWDRLTESHENFRSFLRRLAGRSKH